MHGIPELPACSGHGIRDNVEHSEPSYAKAPSATGALANLATRIEQRHEPGTSGFKLLDSSEDGLVWRHALIDSAVSSLDIVTHLWYRDVSGKLILERAVLAA